MRAIILLVFIFLNCNIYSQLNGYYKGDIGQSFLFDSLGGFVFIDDIKQFTAVGKGNYSIEDSSLVLRFNKTKFKPSNKTFIKYVDSVIYGCSNKIMVTINFFRIGGTKNDKALFKNVYLKDKNNIVFDSVCNYNLSFPEILEDKNSYYCFFIDKHKEFYIDIECGWYIENFNYKSTIINAKSNMKISALVVEKCLESRKQVFDYIYITDTVYKYPILDMQEQAFFLKQKKPFESYPPKKEWIKYKKTQNVFWNNSPK